jgi:hypothetical protein
MYMEKGRSQITLQKAVLFGKPRSIGGKNVFTDLSTFQRVNTTEGGNHNLRSIQG